MLIQEMPRASVGNRKLTNIGVGGDSIMGIRRVPEDDTYADPTLAGDAMEKPITRPLRYTPGLKCDAHLESLRPERASNHRAIQVCRKMSILPYRHFSPNVNYPRNVLVFRTI